jgi:glycerate 2-kinase
MISAESFMAFSLQTHPWGQAITRVLAAALGAVEPGEAVRRSVQRQGNRLIISGVEYDLEHFQRVCMLGIGKAAIPMTAALGGKLGGRLAFGLAITKHIGGIPVADLPYEVLQGDHPLPGERSLEAGRRVVEFVSGLEAHDLLICLISGGGSALVSAPVEGVSLEDLQALTSALLACGAPIQEINALRRRLDRLKGGGVVRMANGATIAALILSDVVGNPLEAIASGPTVPDPLPASTALEILDRYELEGKIPTAILQALETYSPRTGPGDPAFERVQNCLVGSNLLAAQAALKQAQEEGFSPYLLRLDVEGEARSCAFELATYLRQAALTSQPVPPPACIVAGGETTVTLRGNGKGGRNTELALAAVTELAGYPGVMLISLATDGEDGPTDAAGAVVTGETWRRANDLGLDAGQFLKRNDSYSYFEALGDLLKPGPSGTNVNDLIFLFTF